MFKKIKKQELPLLIKQSKEVQLKSALEKIEESKHKLYSEQPFYANLLNRCIISVGFDVQTACVRILPSGKLEMYINPEFFLSLPFNEKCGLNIHEMLHLMHDHIPRAAGLDPATANTTMDLAINQHIPLQYLPACAVTLEGLAKDLNVDLKRNQPFEEYYLLLKAHKDKLKKYNNCPKHGHKNKNDSSNGESQDQNSQQNEDSSNDSQQQESSQKSIQQNSEENKESKSSNNDSDEQKDSQENNDADNESSSSPTEQQCTCGEDHETSSDMKVLDDHSQWQSSLSDEESKRIIQQWIENAKEDTIRQGNVASIPQALLDQVEKILKINAIEWRRIYRNYLRGKKTFDKVATRKRPNRRLGLKTTGQKPGTGPEIMIATDCSGSVDDESYLIFMTESINSTKPFKEKVKLYFFDYDLLRDKKGEPLAYKIGTQKTVPRRPQDGGTSFQPIIDHANKVKPDLLIIFTDGEASPPTNIRCNVLWVIKGKDNPNLAHPLSKRIILPEDWKNKKTNKVL